MAVSSIIRLGVQTEIINGSSFTNFHEPTGMHSESLLRNPRIQTIFEWEKCSLDTCDTLRSWCRLLLRIRRRNWKDRRAWFSHSSDQFFLQIAQLQHRVSSYMDTHCTQAVQQIEAVTKEASRTHKIEERMNSNQIRFIAPPTSHVVVNNNGTGDHVLDFLGFLTAN